MRLTEIRLLGGAGIVLPIKNAKPSDAFLFKGADGLGAPGSAVSIRRNLRGKGSMRGRRPEVREINIRIGLNAQHYSAPTLSTITASELRDEVYKLLTPSNVGDDNAIQLFNADGLWCSSVGYVKKVEPNIFSADPEVIVTMETLNPYFDGPLTTLSLTTLNANKATPVFPNPGSAPAEFEACVKFTKAQSLFWLYHTTTGKFMEVKYPFPLGAELRIDTRFDNRSILLVQGSTVKNLIGYLTEASDWLALQRGDNNYITSSVDYTWTLFRFTPQYWGA